MCFISIRLVGERGISGFLRCRIASRIWQSWFLSCLVMPLRWSLNYLRWRIFIWRWICFRMWQPYRCFRWKMNVRSFCLCWSEARKAGVLKSVAWISLRRKSRNCLCSHWWKNGKLSLPSVEKSSVIYTNRTLPSWRRVRLKRSPLALDWINCMSTVIYIRRMRLSLVFRDVLLW